MSEADQIILASGSPRRRELLEQLRIRFRVRVPGIDETPRPHEPPGDYVERLARSKAAAGRAGEGGLLPALGADTTVAVDGVMFGKPEDEGEAMAMLRTLSGRTHDVFTAVAVAGPTGVQAVVSRSRVSFRNVDADEAARYWATGEPRDKAGGYAIQGLGGMFVARLEGSYSAVVGLPLAETEVLLRAAGVDCWRYRDC